MPKIIKVLSILIFLISGCFGVEQTEEEKMRRQNAKGEYILRYHHEYRFKVEAPKLRQRAPYPWEESTSATPSKNSKT